MGRNPSGVYSLPAGSLVSDGATSAASQHNTPLQDLETDMNAARPVVAGGTGATTAADARTNLAVPGKAVSETISGAWTVTGNWTFAATTIADLGTVTTADINGGSIDGTPIGASSASTGAFTTVTASTGIYLGGTGSANLLDDYEEGTFDSHIKDNDGIVVTATGQGKYTKIGNIVYITIEVFANGVTSVAINGNPYITLPFTTADKTNSIFLPHYYSGVGAINSGYTNSGQSDKIMLSSSRDEPFGNTASGTTIGGNVRLYGAFVYRVTT